MAIRMIILLRCGLILQQNFLNMKSIVSLLILLFCCSSLSFADSVTLGSSCTNVNLNKKSLSTKRPRSVVSPVVQCWFDNGYLVFIVDEDESIETIKLTDLSTGNVTLENIASGTRQYTMYIGTSSVNIEVTLADGSEYEGMFVQ